MLENECKYVIKAIFIVNRNLVKDKKDRRFTLKNSVLPYDEIDKI